MTNLLQVGQYYVRSGMDVIPIHANDKRPIGDNWNEKPALTLDGVAQAVAEGLNLGVRMRECDLIIDVDVKNESPGAMSYRRLVRDVPELAEIQTCTYTVSGGQHILLELPLWIDASQLRYTHSTYPGMQFLSHKKQALIGGSSVDGRYYNLNSAFTLPAPEAPAQLLDLLIEPEFNKGEVLESDADARSLGWGCITPEELWMLLQHLPAEDYGAATPNMWFDMMCASHFATGGEGYAEFVAWSVRDPIYADHEPLHRNRWKSLNAKVGRKPITAHYLRRELSRVGVVVEWFEDRLRLAKATIMLDPEAADQQASINRGATYTQMIAEVKDPLDVRKVLTQLVLDKASATETQAALTRLAEKHKYLKVGAMREDLKEIQQGLDDNAEDMTENQLCHAFIRAYGGKQYVRHVDGRLWLWQRDKGIFKGYSHTESKGLVKAFMEQNKQRVTGYMVSNVANLVTWELQAQQSSWDDAEGLDGRMFNMRNGELWITPKGYDLRPHSPANMRRAVLDIDYDPENRGTPARWSAYLESAFSANALPTVSDLLALGMAYSLTESHPWLKKAWFLYGPPNTGKSVVVDLIGAMAGKGQRAGMDFARISGNRFGPAGLVGKLVNVQGEVTGSEQIEPSVFKALVAGDPMEAERKGEDAFMLENRAVFWMAGNHMPRFKRGSSGVVDRFVIIPFENALKSENLDPHLLTKFKAEVADIFHWCLHRYAAAYRKDKCSSLAATTVTTDERTQALSDSLLGHLRWVEECLVFEDGAFTATADMYSSYADWHEKHDIGRYFGNVGQFGTALSEWLREVPGHRVEAIRRRTGGRETNPKAGYLHVRLK